MPRAFGVEHDVVGVARVGIDRRLEDIALAGCQVCLYTVTKACVVCWLHRLVDVAPPYRWCGHGVTNDVLVKRGSPRVLAGGDHKRTVSTQRTSMLCKCVFNQGCGGCIDDWGKKCHFLNSCFPTPHCAGLSAHTTTTLGKIQPPPTHDDGGGRK